MEEYSLPVSTIDKRRVWLLVEWVEYSGTRWNSVTHLHSLLCVILLFSVSKSPILRNFRRMHEWKQRIYLHCVMFKLRRSIFDKNWFLSVLKSVSGNWVHFSQFSNCSREEKQFLDYSSVSIMQAKKTIFTVFKLPLIINRTIFN